MSIAYRGLHAHLHLPVLLEMPASIRSMDVYSSRGFWSGSQSPRVRLEYYSSYCSADARPHNMNLLRHCKIDWHHYQIPCVFRAKLRPDRSLTSDHRPFHIPQLQIIAESGWAVIAVTIFRARLFWDDELCAVSYYRMLAGRALVPIQSHILAVIVRPF